jgi:AI-2 transport protein TqsA
MSATGSQIKNQQQSLVRLIVGLTGVVIILAGMWASKSIVNLVLMAGMLTMLFAPVHLWFQRHGMKGWISLLLIVIGVLLGAVAILLLAGISVAQIVVSIPQYEDSFSSQLTQLEEQLEQVGVDPSSFTSAASALAKGLFGALAGLASSTLSLIVNGVFVVLIFAYMLGGTSQFVKRLQENVSPDSLAYKNAGNSVSAVVTFLSILAVVNAIIAVGDMLLLWALGVPHVLLWGLMAFIFGFIPYVGFWIAMIPPMVFAFGLYGIVGAIAVIIGYWFINGTLSNVVAPHFYGTGLDIAPVLALVAVMFWGFLLGPVGAVVGVPLTALLKNIVLDSYPETQWLARVLSSKSSETPEVAGG